MDQAEKISKNYHYTMFAFPKASGMPKVFRMFSELDLREVIYIADRL
jgi:hypothetical protein